MMQLVYGIPDELPAVQISNSQNILGSYITK